MKYLILTIVFLYCIGNYGVSFAQKQWTEPKSEVKQKMELQSSEKLDFQRKLLTQMLSDQAKGGVEKIVREGDRIVARIMVAKDGWGDSLPIDVATVCESVAITILKVLKPDVGHEPTIFVVRSSQGPMVLTQRGPKGEYIVLLNSRDRLWAQISYQFAHEMGHILGGDLSMSLPQHWFEESFCEAVSIWTMQQMAESWKYNAPYENWRSYSSSIDDYIEKIRKRVALPDQGYPQWYKMNREVLTQNAIDRDKNLVLAVKLAEIAKVDSRFILAFHYLRASTSRKPTDNMEWVLQNWIENCPENLKFAPYKVAEILDVKPAW